MSVGNSAVRIAAQMKAGMHDTGAVAVGCWEIAHLLEKLR
jgi:hypothetical protein